MEKKEVLIVFPSPRDLRYLSSPTLLERSQPRFLGGYVENPLGFDPISSMSEALAVPKPAGVVATEDYPAAFVASILAHRMGLPGPSPESVLLCQHKYYSRIAQQRSIPTAVPPFCLISLNGRSECSLPKLPFPFFLKPVKGFVSILAGAVRSAEGFWDFITAAQNRLPSFTESFGRLIQEAGLHGRYPIGGNHLIGEGMLSGEQVTLEGYVFQGETHLIDIVDSIFYPGTLSFQRFQTPSRLPLRIQDRMFDLARLFLESIDFNDGLFNLEFIYNPNQESIHLIEANSRMAHQFAGMMEALHGVNPYEILLDLALNRRPSFKRHGGKEKVAASYVLRKFSDALVKSVPGEKEIAAVRGLFPSAEIEILVRPQGRLSDSSRQDEESYRYAIVNLAAGSEAELLEKFRETEKRLP